jgi:DNA-binding transcriptional ArsR family regulator
MQRAGEQVVGAARRTRRKKMFVMVPLEWLEATTRATQTPQAFLSIWLLHLAWKAGSRTGNTGRTFPLPNGQLTEYGVDRRAKRRALANLEKAGLIAVERRGRKTPIITIL